MPDAAPAARGVYHPRRPQAVPLFRSVSDHLHRLQTVSDERFAREAEGTPPPVGRYWRGRPSLRTLGRPQLNPISRSQS
jgi:hypothetical protein